MTTVSSKTPKSRLRSESEQYLVDYFMKQKNYWQSEGHTEHDATVLANRDNFVWKLCNDEQKKKIEKYGNFLVLWEKLQQNPTYKLFFMHTILLSNSTPEYLNELKTTLNFSDKKFELLQMQQWYSEAMQTFDAESTDEFSYNAKHHKNPFFVINTQKMQHYEDLDDTSDDETDTDDIEKCLRHFEYNPDAKFERLERKLARRNAKYERLDRRNAKYERLERKLANM